jgi:serine/threonine protein kinase
MASVRKVTGRGGPVGISTVEDGVPLALKLWQEGDETSLDQLQREAKILVELSSIGGDLPCPRLYDLVGKPLVTGVVMEWCPVDLERWWRDKMSAEDAVGRLMFTLAEATRRVGEYHAFFVNKSGIDGAHGDLKPSNVLLSARGRWLVSDFGTAHLALADDDVWAESRVIVASDNFVAPEVLFNARRRFPEATDVWSLGASVYALLRLKRLVADGGALPRNGTHSPRFRMERMNRVVEIYGRDPSRFVERDLNPDDFANPDHLPEEDQRTLRDSLAGCFGAESPAKEDEFAAALIGMMDRAMSIDPASRFTECEALADRFEGLGRLFIELSAIDERPTPTAEQDVSDIVAARDAASKRARNLQEEVDRLASQLRAARIAPRPEPAIAPAAALDIADLKRELHVEPWRPPSWWSPAILVGLLLQLGIGGLLVLQVVLSWTI